VERLQRSAVRTACVALLLAYVAVTAGIAARANTPTVDEFTYVPTGLYHLRTGDVTHDPSNPPLMKLAMAAPLLAMDLTLDTDPRWRDPSDGWAPWIFGTRFLDQNRARYLDAFFAARLVVVATAVGLGWLLWRRARTVLSPAAALVALALYATMPPILGHAAVATLDVGVTALVFAAFVALARFATTTRLAWAVVTGVCLGLAVATKGVALLFLPLVPVLALVEWAGPRRRGVVPGLVAMAVAAWIALLAPYGFSGFPRLPASFVEGFRFQVAAGGTGEFPAFLAGSWSQTGWWYYYLVALAVKTPLPSLALMAAGTWAVVRERRRSDAWIVLPPLLLVYALSFHFGKDYGIRYLLPAFPFLVLLAGRGADLMLARPRGATVVAALLAWQLVACTLATPHHLAWFNALASGEHARRTLLDSNLDWGQDLGRLRAWMDGRGVRRICLGYFGHVDPGLYGIEYAIAPTRPAPGLCAVSANFLGGYPYVVTYAGRDVLLVPPGTWSWFDRLTPIARVGRSIYVFDVTEDDARRLSGTPAP
jgi:4-amino-4-deoxy-L-arabinose transferase-like glycosyltransferase